MTSYVYVWHFTVPEPSRTAFEKLYGPSGAWARLFSSSPFWLGTDLLSDADRPGVYLTIDRWASRAAQDALHRAAGPAWDEVDRLGEALTTHEELLGHFAHVP